MAWMMNDPDKHLNNLEKVATLPAFASYRDEAHGDLGFALWLALVDKRLSHLGVSHSDLADFCSRDLYEDGVSPREGAARCLANDDGFSFEMFE